MKQLVAFILLSAVTNASVAATAAQQFGAHRWPTQPKLSVNLQPDLCSRILSDAVQAFASVDTDMDIASAIGTDFKPLSVKPAMEGVEEDTPSPLSRLDLDLDGNGHPQIVIVRDNSFNWRGDWHYAYVFPSAAAFESAKAQIAQDWSTTPQDQVPSAMYSEFSAQQYYPSALTNDGREIQTGNVWADHALFEANKHYYFANGTTAFDRESPAPVQIFRLFANGHVQVVCQIDDGTLDETYKAFQALPVLRAFLKTIRTIGAGGEDGGTMHSGLVHDNQATASEIRAATRPWATSASRNPAYAGDNPYYRFDERTRAFLDDWSLEELWNRREYQTLMELTGPAEASYASYLQSAFGVSADTARIDAIRVIEALIGARLEIPNEFTIEHTSLYFPSTPIHEAVMRRDRAAFDAALASPEPAAAKSPGLPVKPLREQLSDAVSDSVEWPYGLDRLLAAGANPDQANQFGKTPLMVAAHFDRPDAVERLLAAGAKIDAVTTVGTTGGIKAPNRSARTALMYAAENASPTTIKALLDAGANANAKDSDGNGMSFYLDRNPRFSAAQRALGVTGLATAVDQFAGPSFSCAKARSPTEQAICGSEVLRIFDLQMANAFAAVRSKAGSSLVAEERSWLQSRDRSCAADVDCLAETMRTHLRYLQERMDE